MGSDITYRMNQVHLDFFRNLLLDERERLLAKLNPNKDGFRKSLKDFAGENASYYDNMAEVGSDANEQEKAFFFATREARTLYLIDQALNRIRQGNYGICLHCNHGISRSRLQSIPYSSLCIDCKSKEGTLIS